MSHDSPCSGVCAVPPTHFRDRASQYRRYRNVGWRHCQYFVGGRSREIIDQNYQKILRKDPKAMLYFKIAIRALTCNESCVEYSQGDGAKLLSKQANFA